MREDEELAIRLAKLQGGSSASHNTAGVGSTKGMAERLKALSGGDGSTAGEEEFNSRLSALTEEEGGKVSSADDLAARFGRLTSDVGGGGSAPSTSAQQQYDVPEDFSDEWQDLDDLLEDVLGAGDLPGITSTVEKSSVPADESQVNAKLSQVDALLVAQAECVAAGRRGEAGTTAGFEQAGIEATKSMEAFLGGGGEATNNGLASYRRPPDNVGLGDEEERLLQMVTDQVSLEGHGIIARATTATPAHETAGGMWLPIAPTAPPVAVAYPTARHPTNDDVAASQAGAARLIAQQAMDEARLLGLSDDATEEEKQAPPSAPGKGQGAKKTPQNGGESESCSSWCCICAEDAAYRCGPCEDENGADDEPELFCARCFKEVHRDDPEMKAHQPQALLKRGGQGTKKKGLRNWKKK